VAGARGRDLRVHDDLLGLGAAGAAGARLPRPARALPPAGVRARRGPGDPRVARPDPARGRDRPARRAPRLHRTQRLRHPAAAAARHRRVLPGVARRGPAARHVRRLLRGRHPVRELVVPSGTARDGARHLRDGQPRDGDRGVHHPAARRCHLAGWGVPDRGRCDGGHGRRGLAARAQRPGVAAADVTDDGPAPDGAGVADHTGPRGPLRHHLRRFRRVRCLPADLPPRGLRPDDPRRGGAGGWVHPAGHVGASRGRHALRPVRRAPGSSRSR
jgi:hypothetical protein